MLGGALGRDLHSIGINRGVQTVAPDGSTPMNFASAQGLHSANSSVAADQPSASFKR
jgi:hypothetical protein